MGHPTNIHPKPSVDGFFLATMAGIILLCMFTLIVLIGIF